MFSHDTRNLLQVLLSSIELSLLYFKSNKPPEKFEELLYFCKLQILKGAYMVNIVNKVSEMDQVKRQLKQINILYYLKKAIINVREYSHGKIARITIKNESQDLHVKADEFLVDAFEHVLINAIHHGQNPDVEIDIKIRNIEEKDENYIRIEFIDNGPGIPDLKKDLIFRNIDEDDNHESRTGLGFYLIKEIFKPYDAQVRVENKIPENYTKGSKFIFTFYQK